MNKCPSCKRIPFGVLESAPTYIEGEPYAAVQCSYCKYVVGISKLPKIERGWGTARVETLWAEFTEEAR